MQLRRFDQLLNNRLAADRRKGAILVLAAVLLTAMFGFVAFALDVGLICLAKAELQNAADAGALAGVQMLGNGPGAVRDEATLLTSKNDAAGTPVEILAEDVEIGHLDPVTQEFTALPADQEHAGTAVRVTCRRSAARGNPLQLFFAPIIGSTHADVAESAIATLRPRDVMLVVDLSGSMNDDGKVASIPYLGQDDVEQQLEQIWNDLGAPAYGAMGFSTVHIEPSPPDDDDDDDDSPPFDPVAEIKTALNLDGVSYPHPGATWEEYIEYVRNDPILAIYGYDHEYGMLTLVEFWLRQAGDGGSPTNLWQTSEQPIGALKSAVQLYCDVVSANAADDRVGMAAYTYPDSSGAVLESGLTFDVPSIAAIMWQRRAGHYDPYTNIGAGIREARLELAANARPAAEKIIVLMTDGRANRPDSTSTARQFAIDEADHCADSGITIMCVSLGRNADRVLLTEIAGMTGGRHYSVPADYNIAEYNAQMLAFYREIAESRHGRLSE
ncbi:MAG: TadE/TadG family protein [Planctomycetota bacterium]|nr:MAG: TadE/TadG family protein [Planctomycetota bacterium]REJ90743.1 MAG: TadE/TadG family protein [Planctomycetota bacterium]REK26711.1 MAG: TadE/TadG family protein [Planctomycetota bacterium]REK35628.1 MAG: TadE/TadG family protein [Planctomycetota bacterium]